MGSDHLYNCSGKGSSGRRMVPFPQARSDSNTERRRAAEGKRDVALAASESLQSELKQSDLLNAEIVETVVQLKQRCSLRCYIMQCYILHTPDCMLPTTHYPLPTTHYPLPTTHYILHTTLHTIHYFF